LFSSKETNKIAEILIQYEKSAKEREIELLKKEKLIAGLNLDKQKYQFNLSVGGLVFLFVVILLLYFTNRRTKASKSLVEQKNEELKSLNAVLEEKIGEVKALSGLLPICSSCKKIRNDAGYWEQLEGFISKNSSAKFSHGICPDCANELYPEYMRIKKSE
jgi:hypothetical protein